MNFSETDKSCGRQKPAAFKTVKDSGMDEKKNDKGFFKKLGNIFDIRLLPMDLGRLTCFFWPIGFRIKKVDQNGAKYKGIIKGSAVIAPNHTSFLDPFAVGSCFWYRRMFFLTGEVVMTGRIRTLLLKGMGCIKVDRGISDIEAIHKVRKVLNGSHVTTVFPQGGLKDVSEGVGELKSGAVLIALQNKTPIVPVYSEKTRKVLERRIFVIGEPIDPALYVKGRFPSMDDIGKVTEALKESMDKCRDTFLKMKGYN